MGVSTVKLNGATLMTVADSTATAADVASDEYFYAADGTKTRGTLDMDRLGDILYYTAQTVSKATGAQICRIPASGTDSAITADHILLEAVFAKPGVIAGDVSWQTYAGYMTLTGTALAATTVSVTIGKKMN